MFNSAAVFVKKGEKGGKSGETKPFCVKGRK